MPYVNVPNDLSKIKTKIAFNLTRRQLICFGGAAAVGIPVYLLTRHALGGTGAMFLMIALMLPAFFMAMYERDGLPFEKVLQPRRVMLLPSWATGPAWSCSHGRPLPAGTCGATRWSRQRISGIMGPPQNQRFCGERRSSKMSALLPFTAKQAIWSLRRRGQKIAERRTYLALCECSQRSFQDQDENCL